MSIQYRQSVFEHKWSIFGQRPVLHDVKKSFSKYLFSSYALLVCLKFHHFQTLHLNYSNLTIIWKYFVHLILHKLSFQDRLRLFSRVFWEFSRLFNCFNFFVIHGLRFFVHHRYQFSFWNSYVFTIDLFFHTHSEQWKGRSII